MTVSLILGGARSGKSRRAQSLAEAHVGPRVFIATAEAMDDEMKARIAQHQADRGEEWTHAIEAPVDLANALTKAEDIGRVILVDCLTVWLSNLMYHEVDLDSATDALLKTLQAARTDIILVSNEVGLGLVPETPLGREFRDLQGRLNQQVAGIADRVEFVAAGLPLTLKG